MKKFKFSVFFILSLLSSVAFAGEGFFSRTYTAETVPKGHYELEQTVRNRFGRAFGNYSAYDFRSEFEYGITDDLQAAFYVNTGIINAKGAPDDDDPNGATGFSRNRFFLTGLSGEFIYRVISPIGHAVGLAFYFEPEVLFYDQHNGLKYDHTLSTEYRMILQKNFLDDTLIVAYNLSLETEFVRFEGDADWKGELDWNNELGVTYRLTSNWYGGLEARNHNELGNFEVHEHSVYWAGPVLHYGGEKLWATLGLLAQVYGVPHGTDENGTLIGRNNMFLRSHEQFETTLKVGLPF